MAIGKKLIKDSWVLHVLCFTTYEKNYRPTLLYLIEAQPEVARIVEIRKVSLFIGFIFLGFGCTMNNMKMPKPAPALGFGAPSVSSIIGATERALGDEGVVMV